VKGNTILRDVPITLGLIGQSVSEVTEGLTIGDVIGLDFATNRFVEDDN